MLYEWEAILDQLLTASRDGELFKRWISLEDQQTYLWHALTQKKICYYSLNGHNYWCSSDRYTVSPDSVSLWLGREDRMDRSWCPKPCKYCIFNMRMNRLVKIIQRNFRERQQVLRTINLRTYQVTGSLNRSLKRKLEPTKVQSRKRKRTIA